MEPSAERYTGSGRVIVLQIASGSFHSQAEESQHQHCVCLLDSHKESWVNLKLMPETAYLHTVSFCLSLQMFPFKLFYMNDLQSVQCHDNHTTQHLSSGFFCDRLIPTMQWVFMSQSYVKDIWMKNDKK